MCNYLESVTLDGRACAAKEGCGRPKIVSGNKWWNITVSYIPLKPAL